MKESFYTLRGLLSLWVLLGHMLLVERYGAIYNAGFANHADFGALGAFTMLHFVAVDIFFMLSGYALANHYRDVFTPTVTSAQIDQFYLKRLSHIWPLHMAMVAMIGFMHWLAIPHPISSGHETLIFNHWEWTFLLNALLMNGWGIIPVASWNEPAWTLSITFFLYLIFPNLMLMMRRIPSGNRTSALIIVSLILGYAALREFVVLGSHSDGNGALLRGLIFFVCGISLSNITLKNAHGVAIFLAATFVWTYVYAFPIWILHLTYPLLLLSIPNMHRSLLPEGISHWLGSRSLAIFLTHYPVLLMVGHIAGEQLGAWATEGDFIKMLCYAMVLGTCLLSAEVFTRLFVFPFRSKSSNS